MHAVCKHLKSYSHLLLTRKTHDANDIIYLDEVIVVLFDLAQDNKKQNGNSYGNVYERRRPAMWNPQQSNASLVPCRLRLYFDDSVACH